MYILSIYESNLVALAGVIKVLENLTSTIPVYDIDLILAFNSKLISSMLTTLESLTSSL